MFPAFVRIVVVISFQEEERDECLVTASFKSDYGCAECSVHNQCNLFAMLDHGEGGLHNLDFL